MIHLTSKLKESLRARLLFWVWLVSSLATFIFTSAQLFSEYKLEQDKAYDQINVIRRNYLPLITKSVWDYNENYMELQMSSLKNLPYISSFSIVSDKKTLYSYSTSEHIDEETTTSFPLIFENDNIGTLKVGINLKAIKSNYMYKAFKIFLAQGFKTMIVCLLLLQIFQLIIMKHLQKIFSYLKTYDLNDGKMLTLNRDPQIKDEFEMIISLMNKLKIELSKNKRSLEEKVEERSRQLDEERMKNVHSARLAALGEMAGGIAHEINNPLAIISMSTNILKKLKKNNRISEDLFDDSITNIENTLDRISRIIKGLRTVSRDSGSFNKEPVNLFEIFQDVLGLCSEKFKNHGILIKMEEDFQNLNRTILCDRVQLSQVLLNLLGNSFDAIEKHEEKWVEINYMNEGQFDIIKIKDSGKGLPPEIIEKMFNPFYTSKEIGKGTGLGLSISKGIMEKHGGSLEFDSSHPNTCFVLKMPIA